MSNVVFADAEAFYDRFLEFILQSPTTVTHNDKSYTIHHTQFAGYNVQRVFSHILEQTTTDPRDDETDFNNEVETVLNKLDDIVLSRELRNHYHHTMYIRPRRISMVSMDYVINYNSDFSIAPFTPQATTKAEAVAEILTLYHGEKAGLHSRVLSNDTSPVKYQTDVDHCPNKGVIPAEYSCAIKHIIETDGNDAITRPDPSKRAIREIFTILKDVGIEPKIRDVYSFFVELDKSSYYNFRDTMNRELTTSFTDSILKQNPPEKWASNNEPPLETILNNKSET